MYLPLGLLLGTLLIMAVVSSSVIPLTVCVLAGCLTSLFQIYTFPIAGIYLSAALMCWLAAWRFALPDSGLWQWTWMRALLLFNVVGIVSIVWSPNKVLGIRYFIYSLPLLLAAHAIYALTRANPKAARRCVHVLLASTLVEAVLVIIFRLLPNVELAFLRSPVARLFISANSLIALFTTSPNNVLDPDKAGGFFLNANVASAFLGFCAVSAWYIGQADRSVLLRVVAFFNWFAVLLAGSKAALVLALAVPVLVLIVETFSSRQINLKAIIGGLLTASVAFVAVALLWNQSLASRFEHDSLSTLGTRRAIWGFARQAIQTHPFLGLGFGGWDKEFPLYAFMHGVGFNFPPHNSLLIAWTQSGLPGVLAAVCWIAAVYVGITRAVRMGGAVGQLGLGVGGAFTWYLIQGFGENIGVIGEVHLTPFLGLLLGYMCARCEAIEAINVRDVASDRGSFAASTVPAI
jgi:O-antigen ligase